MQGCLVVNFSEVLHEVSYLRYAQCLKLCFSNSIWSSLHDLGWVLIRVKLDTIQEIGPKVRGWALFREWALIHVTTKLRLEHNEVTFLDPSIAVPWWEGDGMMSNSAWIQRWWRRIFYESDRQAFALCTKLLVGVVSPSIFRQPKRILLCLPKYTKCP